MRKIISALLILCMLIAFVPAASAEAVSTDGMTQLKTAAEKVVKDYAAKVNQSEAADEAFEDFFIHGFFANGSDMILKESDPMVAALFNSYLMQETLVETIYRGIAKIHELNLPSLFASGGPSWHNYGYKYSMTAYVNKADALEGGDSAAVLDYYSSRLGSLCSPKENYGTDEATNSAMYKGPINRNDEVMELLSGGIILRVFIVPVEVKENAVKYKLEIKVYDDFNFTSDYYKIAEKGFDTTKDQRLKNLGVLMTMMGLDEFYWEYTTELSIEVPYECDHGGNSYHWTYDGENLSLINDVENGFAQGNTTKIEYVNSKDGAVSYYFKLDEPIVLSHDKPWVLEMETQGLASMHFSAIIGTNYRYPSILQYSRNNSWIYKYEATAATNGKGITDYTRHYVGVNLKDEFKYKSKHIYTTTIENVPENGGNMIYVSIFDNDLGETVFGPTAMTAHWTQTKGESSRTQQAEPNYMANGMDLVINYLGSSSYRFTKNHRELYIYENGRQQLSETHFSESYVAPTCTTAGGVKQTCLDCGYSYYSRPEAALGHSYGEYVSDGNATCTADGSKTAECTRCGVKDTVSDVGSAKGHSYTSTTVEASCTTAGYTVHTCHCGDTYTDNNIEAFGHSWDEGSMDKRPVTGVEGEMIYTCHTCGEVRNEAIPAIPAAGFEDVFESDYFYEGVNWAYSKSITGGLSANKFGPAESCTRAQVVTFLWRAAGEPAVENAENPFTDIEEGQYYYDAVLWALEKGITTGLSEDTFGPKANCNRGQIVTFLWRAMDKPAYTASENSFADLQENAYYYDAVLWAVEKGITTGISTDSFAPNATCTRGQIVTFLYRAYQ
ncbi:MAG: S-layer homology domain-containing protein [Oscillospiraceae bacterium]|nr:S-layer homology domain-containing protein [Oscillospiraceae bacterium]